MADTLVKWHSSIADANNTIWTPGEVFNNLANGGSPALLSGFNNRAYKYRYMAIAVRIRTASNMPAGGRADFYLRPFASVGVGPSNSFGNKVFSPRDLIGSEDSVASSSSLDIVWLNIRLDPAVFTLVLHNNLGVSTSSSTDDGVNRLYYHFYNELLTPAS